MLKATITVKEDSKELKKLFEFEDKEFQNQRASYETKLDEEGLIFIAEAKDATALRSVLNTITKLLSVHEKTKNALKK
jgi:tRNA threonylcarbamoyladenosine modification (KEOPS) complex  Pcc1 subunit